MAWRLLGLTACRLVERPAVERLALRAHLSSSSNDDVSLHQLTAELSALRNQTVDGPTIAQLHRQLLPLMRSVELGQLIEVLRLWAGLKPRVFSSELVPLLEHRVAKQINTLQSADIGKLMLFLYRLRVTNPAGYFLDAVERRLLSLLDELDERDDNAVQTMASVMRAYAAFSWQPTKTVAFLRRLQAGGVRLLHTGDVQDLCHLLLGTAKLADRLLWPPFALQIVVQLQQRRLNPQQLLICVEALVALTQHMYASRKNDDQQKITDNNNYNNDDDDDADDDKTAKKKKSKDELLTETNRLLLGVIEAGVAGNAGEMELRAAAEMLSLLLKHGLGLRVVVPRLYEELVGALDEPADMTASDLTALVKAVGLYYNRPRPVDPAVVRALFGHVGRTSTAPSARESVALAVIFCEYHQHLDADALGQLNQMVAASVLPRLRELAVDQRVRLLLTPLPSVADSPLPELVAREHLNDLPLPTLHALFARCVDPPQLDRAFFNSVQQAMRFFAAKFTVAQVKFILTAFHLRGEQPAPLFRSALEAWIQTNAWPAAHWNKRDVDHLRTLKLWPAIEKLIAALQLPPGTTAKRSKAQAKSRKNDAASQFIDPYT